MPAGAALKSEELQVTLPVCPNEDCRRVGKLPADHFGGKEYCVGLIGHGHKKVRMEKRTFALVEDGSDS